MNRFFLSDFPDSELASGALPDSESVFSASFCATTGPFVGSGVGARISAPIDGRGSVDCILIVYMVALKVPVGVARKMIRVVEEVSFRGKR